MTIEHRKLVTLGFILCGAFVIFMGQRAVAHNQASTPIEYMPTQKYACEPLLGVGELDVRMVEKPDYDKTCVDIIEDGINGKLTSNEQWEQRNDIIICVWRLYAPINSGDYIPEDTIGVTNMHEKVVEWHTKMVNDSNCVQQLPSGTMKILKNCN